MTTIQRLIAETIERAARGDTFTISDLSDHTGRDPKHAAVYVLACPHGQHSVLTFSERDLLAFSHPVKEGITRRLSAETDAIQRRCFHCTPAAREPQWSAEDLARIAHSVGIARVINPTTRTAVWRAACACRWTSYSPIRADVDRAGRAHTQEAIDAFGREQPPSADVAACAACGRRVASMIEVDGAWVCSDAAGCAKAVEILAARITGFTASMERLAAIDSPFSHIAPTIDVVTENLRRLSASDTVDAFRAAAASWDSSDEPSG